MNHDINITQAEHEGQYTTVIRCGYHMATNRNGNAKESLRLAYGRLLNSMIAERMLYITEVKGLFQIRTGIRRRAKVTHQIIKQS